MRFAIALAGKALVLALSVAACAQSSVQSSAQSGFQSGDMDYCAVLVASYDKYVLATGSRGSRQPPMANVDQAKAKCQTDPERAIPDLEKALTDAKIGLPKRG